MCYKNDIDEYEYENKFSTSEDIDDLVINALLHEIFLFNSFERSNDKLSSDITDSKHCMDC